MSAEPRSHDASFVPAYLLARERERRLLPDDVVRSLPALPHAQNGDPLAGEWRQRADSARRFLRYLTAMRAPVHVWDLGCGNGWFTAQLASLDGVSATGVDINTTELAQARRVFGDRPQLQFRDGDLREAVQFIGHAPPAAAGLDVVLLASTLQYVADASGLLRGLLDALPPRAEIHVLDTPIYRRDQVQSARERTRSHYGQLGVAAMVDHYHHHDWSTFAGLPHQVLYRPGALGRRIERRVLRRPISPFPWIRITSRTQR
jgi:SAM-dependent methyltransferase